MIDNPVPNKIDNHILIDVNTSYKIYIMNKREIVSESFGLYLKEKHKAGDRVHIPTYQIKSSLQSLLMDVRSELEQSFSSDDIAIIEALILSDEFDDLKEVFVRINKWFFDKGFTRLFNKRKVL